MSEDVTSALSPDERARPGRSARAGAGRHWAAARGVLRALLGSYLHVEPASLRFSVGRHGKPRLADALAGSSISFNASHSGALALFALSHAGDCGVDVEVDRTRAINEPALAQRALGEPEGRRLARLQAAERRREFLRAWTRHEASLKCRGAGIWCHGEDVGPERNDALRLWVADLELGANTAGALAVATPPRELRLFDWRG